MQAVTKTNLFVDEGDERRGRRQLLDVAHVAIDLLLKVLLVERGDRAIVEHQLETLLLG